MIQAQKAGENFAGLPVLKRYESLRRQENLKMMTLMDLFYYGFSNEILPLKLIRNFGLGFAQRIAPLRKKIMKTAMGLEGRLPKMARGEPLL